MGRMIFELTDEDRAALERIRIALGCRSHAETLRRIIREFWADIHLPTVASLTEKLAQSPPALRMPRAKPGSRLKVKK